MLFGYKHLTRQTDFIVVYIICLVHEVHVDRYIGKALIQIWGEYTKKWVIYEANNYMFK